MHEFDVHFDEETTEALRNTITNIVFAERTRRTPGGAHMGRFNSETACILATRLMHGVEDKLFELRVRGVTTITEDPTLAVATLDSLELILFGDIQQRSRDELEARASEAICALNAGQS